MMTAFALTFLIGLHVHWADRMTGEVSCGTLTSIDYRDRAWIVPDRNPQWYAIEPVSIVKAGCPQ